MPVPEAIPVRTGSPLPEMLLHGPGVYPPLGRISVPVYHRMIELG